MTSATGMQLLVWLQQREGSDDRRKQFDPTSPGIDAECFDEHPCLASFALWPERCRLHHQAVGLERSRLFSLTSRPRSTSRSTLRSNAVWMSDPRRRQPKRRAVVVVKSSWVMA
jgi:hypothetical protein